MRDQSMVDRIAARRNEILAKKEAEYVQEMREIQRQVAEASTGPRFPRGCEVKPTKTSDWGLMTLRDLSWLARRNGTKLRTAHPRLP